MSIIVRTLLALFASSFVASTAAAGFGDFQVGGNGPDKVLKAQFGIKAPTGVCPTEGERMGWVFTNYKGPVQVMIARKGGSVSAPFTIHTVKAANGQYMASFKHTFQILGPVDEEYRLLAVPGVVSNWVRLKAC